jgi:hypothetical protein
MNAVSGVILAVLLLVVCVASHRWAALGMIAGVFFLTQGHAVDLLGLNLYPIRLLESAAVARVVVRGNLVWSTFNRIDWLLLALYNYAAAISIARSSEVTAYQVAAAVDPTLCYLAFRGLIGTLDDVRWLLIRLVGVLFPFTLLVYSERWTGASAFTLVGSDPQLIFRNGIARCQGTFRHAILLGSIAASFLPLYAALWGAGRRAVAACGAILCLTLVFLANSGGPVTSTAAAVLGWAAWPVRMRMRLINGTALGLLLLLIVGMNAPIWYLPFKISSIVGGGGYHRAVLMEQAWHHLDRWGLFGMDVTETVSWFPYTLDAVGGADFTNQFLVFGIDGGIPTLLLCAGLLIAVFRTIGRAGASLRLRSDDAGRNDELLVWGIGVTVFVHLVSWMGVSYFDQSWVIWLAHVAVVSAARNSLAAGFSPTAEAAPPALIPVNGRLARPYDTGLRVRRRLFQTRRFPDQNVMDSGHPSSPPHVTKSISVGAAEPSSRGTFFAGRGHRFSRTFHDGEDPADRVHTPRTPRRRFSVLRRRS